jgi:hypothetical protein
LPVVFWSAFTLDPSSDTVPERVSIEFWSGDRSVVFVVETLITVPESVVVTLEPE